MQIFDKMNAIYGERVPQIIWTLNSDMFPIV